MDYSNLSSKLSFREKLSYIQNSDEYKGVFSRFKVVFKLILSFGYYNLHLTEEKCFAAKKNNGTCIFARKIDTFTPNPSISTGSSPAESHAKKKKKLTTETLMQEVTKEKKQAKKEKPSTLSTGGENPELKKKLEMREEKIKTPFSEGVVNDPIVPQTHRSDDVRRESSDEEDKENISHLTKYITAAKDEIKNWNKAEQEKKAAKHKAKDKDKDKDKDKTEIEDNKSEVEKENNSLNTQEPLNESSFKINIFSEKVNKLLGGMGGQDGDLNSLIREAKTPEHRQSIASLVKRYNTLGDLVSKGSKIIHGDLANNINKFKTDFINFRSAFAGNKMTDKNPHITDLSDNQRPMNVGDNFGNLYDNEWTDLMDDLDNKYGKSNGRDEKKICNHVEKCFNFWVGFINKLVSSEDFINMEEYLEKDDVMTNNTTDINKLRRIFTEKRDNKIVLKDVFYTLASELLSMNEYKNNIASSEKFSRNLNGLIAFMMLQESPCALIFPEKDSKFNKDQVRAYTKSGEYVDYPVWPILCLYKDGPLISKGVVQLKSSK